jgi:hypothetical protein
VSPDVELKELGKYIELKNLWYKMKDRTARREKDRTRLKRKEELSNNGKQQTSMSCRGF